MPNRKKGIKEKQVKRINLSLTPGLYDDVEVLSYLFGIPTLSGTVIAILKEYIEKLSQSDIAEKFTALHAITDIKRKYGNESITYLGDTFRVDQDATLVDEKKKQE